MTTVGSQGYALYDKWMMPETLLQEKFAKAYLKHPITSRTVAIGVATLSGILKPFYAVAVSLVGVVVMPIIALISAILAPKGTKLQEAGKWLVSWSFSLLTVTGATAYLLVSAYYLPITYSACLVIGVWGLCIAIHIYKAAKTPEMAFSSNS